MGQIVVEGPDGKKYAFPDTMPREQINAFLRNKYGTKTRDETATQYLQRVGREQKAAEDLRRSKEAQIKDVERAAAGPASEGAMSNPGAFYLAGPNAMQSGREASAPIYKAASMVPEDQAFAGGMANAAGLWLPEMLSQPYREGLARARSDQPGWTMAGDFAGGMMSGEVIGAGLEAGVRAVAPRVRQLGAMFKSGKTAAELSPEEKAFSDMVNRIQTRVGREEAERVANEEGLRKAMEMFEPYATPREREMLGLPPKPEIPSVTISPEERAMLTGEAPKGSTRTVTAKETASQTADPEYMAARKQAFLSPEEIATLLDTPSDIKPGGFDVTRPSVTKRKYGTESFSDPRLSVDQNKAVEMRKNGYTVREIADEMDTSEDVVYHHFMAARRKGVKMGGIAKDNTTVDILTLKEKGLKPREIAERLGVPRNQVNVMLAQARRRIEASGSELPPWLVPGKGGRPMGPAVGDFAENVFSAGVSSAMGSAPTVDINGDGVIDETDRMLGAGAGLALWASPLGLRQAAKLGGMMKGTKSQGLSGLPKTPQQAAKFETPGSPEWEAAKAKGLDMSQAGRMARRKAWEAESHPEVKDTDWYHGTTHDFDSFSSAGNPEGHHGGGAYFSSSPDDVARNYATTKGADLTNRIERRAEQIAYDIETALDDADFDALARMGISKEKAMSEQYSLISRESERLARAEIAGKSEGATIRAAVRAKNPVIVNGMERIPEGRGISRAKPKARSTFWEMDSGYDEALDEFGDPSGPAYDLIEAVRRRLEDAGMRDTDSLIGQLFDEASSNGGLYADDFERIIRNADDMIDYDLSPGQVIQDAYKALGHDGIVLRNAERQFGNMGMSPDTTHLVIFDPSNIRSVNAAFDPDKAASPILTAGMGGK